MGKRNLDNDDTQNRNEAVVLTLSKFRRYIYVRNPKTVATPVRIYTYMDRNMGREAASNGHFTVTAA